MEENTWFEQLTQMVEELGAECTKFYDKDNNSAGTRARKILQDIKHIAQDGRNHIQETKTRRKK